MFRIQVKTMMRCVFHCFALVIMLTGVLPKPVKAANSNRPILQTSGRILYATVDGTISQCSSWEDACSLERAINIATPDDEVWVAEGTYYPTDRTIQDDSRTATFYFLEGAHDAEYYGGFSGVETARDQRDPKAHPTILSGDIGVPGDTSDNAYRVVWIYSGTPLLDGFTITQGNASNNGGGILNTSGHPILQNLIVKDNQASYNGAGMFNGGGATLINVAFHANRIPGDFGAGGGMYNSLNAEGTILLNVEFVGNTANFGGGFANQGPSVRVINSTFVGNSAASAAGAAHDEGGALFVNNIMWGNTANIVYDQFSAYDSTQVLHSLIDQDPCRGTCTAVITGNPQFMRNPDPGVDGAWGTDDDDYGDLRSRFYAPTADTGDIAVLPADVTDLDEDGNTTEPIPYDINGEPRVLDHAGRDVNDFPNPSVDMGAYESRAILYVDRNATGTNTGETWEDAFVDPQSVGSKAYSYPGTEVWIAAGVYTPAPFNPDNPRGAYFSFSDGMKVYGGFRGDETFLHQRDWIANETTLSGDIGIPDDPTDNTHFVVTTGYSDANGMLLDGLTITGAYTDPSDGYYGSGFSSLNSSDTLQNVLITGNLGGSGGGISCLQGDLHLTNVVIANNSATRYGGGIKLDECSASLVNVTIYGNAADEIGGAIYSLTSTFSIGNSILWGNTAPVNAQLSLYDSLSSLRYSILEGGCPTGANCDTTVQDKNPQLVSPLSTNFHLNLTSPAIDAGDNSLLPSDLRDLDGDRDITETIPFDRGQQPRRQDFENLPDTGLGLPPIVDLGAYEAEPPKLRTTFAPNDLTPDEGDTILYTLTLQNTGRVDFTGITIYGSDPIGLEFTGPVTLQPAQPEAVLADGPEAMPVLASNIQLPAGQTCQLTVPVYAWDGPQTVTNTVWMTNNQMEGQTAIFPPAVTIQNSAPAIKLVSPMEVAEGTSVTLRATISDPGGIADPLTYAWDFYRDGSIEFTDTLEPTYPVPGEPGPFPIRLIAQDDDGGLNTLDIDIPITNLPPSVELDEAISLNEGEQITQTATASDPGGGELASAWDLDGDGQFDDGTGNGIIFTAQDGPAVIPLAVRVTDSYGATATDTTQLTVNNLPPDSVDAHGPYIVNEGHQTQLTGSGSDPGPGDTLIFSWDFDNDGQYDDAVGSQPFFDASTLDGPLTVPIGLQVSDGDGGSLTGTTNIQVLEVPPIVTFDHFQNPPGGGELSIVEGVPIVFTDLTGGPDAINTRQWELNGEIVGNLSILEHTFAEDGVSSLQLTVTDSDGSTGFVTQSLTILNADPTLANLTLTSSIFEGGQANLSGQVSDLGLTDPLNLWIDWGDGSPLQELQFPPGLSSFSENHTYLDDAWPEDSIQSPLHVQLSLSDDDGGSDRQTIPITIANANPVVNAGEDQTIRQGETVRLTGSFSDEGMLDIHTVTWSINSEVVAIGTLTPEITFPEAGIFTVTLAVSDDDGGVGTDTVIVAVVGDQPIRVFTFLPFIIR